MQVWGACRGGEHEHVKAAYGGTSHLFHALQKLAKAQESGSTALRRSSAPRWVQSSSPGARGDSRRRACPPLVPLLSLAGRENRFAASPTVLRAPELEYRRLLGLRSILGRLIALTAMTAFLVLKRSRVTGRASWSRGGSVGAFSVPAGPGRPLRSLRGRRGSGLAALVSHSLPLDSRSRCCFLSFALRSHQDAHTMLDTLRRAAGTMVRASLPPPDLPVPPRPAPAI